MQSREYFYELLIRGVPEGIGGIHFCNMQEVLNEDGSVFYGKPSDPKPLEAIADNPELSAVLAALNLQALSSVQTLTTQLAAAEEAKTQLTTERDAALEGKAQAERQVAELQAKLDAQDPVVDGVPQILSFRQAKTFMQLYPVGESDLWTVANAMADAIEDRAERIKVQNYLRDSQQYERQRPELIAMATRLGIPMPQGLDAFFVQAKQL